MKLSEPQKRVLRTLTKRGYYIYINWRGHGSYHFVDRQSLTRCEVSAPPLVARTVRALERRGMLESQDHQKWWGHFVLTPKGREVAKALQDDPG